MNSTNYLDGVEVFKFSDMPIVQQALETNQASDTKSFRCEVCGLLFFSIKLEIVCFPYSLNDFKILSYSLTVRYIL